MGTGSFNNSNTAGWQLPSAPYGWFPSLSNVGTLLYNPNVTGCGDGRSVQVEYNNFVYIGPDGISHYFNSNAYYIDPQHACGLAQPGEPPLGGAFGMPTTIDGYTLNPDFSITTPSGGIQNSGATAQGSGWSSASGNAQDSNGNTISGFVPNLYAEPNGVSAIFTDTLGVTALTGAVTQPTSGVTVVSESYTDSNGQAQTIQLHFSTYELDTNFGCSSTGAPDNSPQNETAQVSGVLILDSILLANGTSYKFTFEPVSGGLPTLTTGRIQTITLPTGGVISYNYGPTDCVDGNPMSLTRTDSDGTWQYARTVSDTVTIQSAGTEGNNYTGNVQSATSTSVTDPLNNVTVISFSGRAVSPYGAPASGSLLTNSIISGIEVDRKVYQGAASGTPIYEKQTCYNGAVPPCISQSASSVPSSYFGYGSEALGFLQIDTYESYNGGALKRTTDIYDPIARLQEEDIYDFGAGQATTKRTRSYVNAGNTWVSEEKITDGNGTTLKDTKYGHDETAAVGTSDVPSHVAVTGARGNLTSVSQWRNTDGAWLTTTYTNDDTGNRLSAKDPNLHMTSYSYADAWANSGSSCVPSTNSYAYLTAVTDALQHQTKTTYYPCTGLPEAVQDPNDLAAGRSGTVYFYDLMQNPTETSHPDGGTTTVNYGGYAIPLTVTTTTQAAPDPSLVSTVVYDRLDRPVNSTAPNGATITTTYDADGRVYSVTNPHLSTSPLTDGTTTYTYDALNRKTIQTQPDGALVQWCYNGMNSGQSSFVCLPNQSSTTAGFWIDYSDELNRHAQRISDAMGRLTAVMEPVANFPTLETDYGYDALNNLVSVKQKGTSGETPRARSFVYDSLSRLTSSTNPETGTIGYGYDPNGNVISKTDARGITTSYTYDALNRLTQKSYSDGVTSTVLYLYDLSNVGFLPVPSDPSRNLTVSPQNSIGRLVIASVTGSTNSAGASMYVYSYDPMGRVVNQWVSTPSYNTGTSPVFPLNYVYDLAGNVTDLTYPSGRHIKQVWNGAGQLSNSTLADIGGVVPSTGQSYLASAIYNPDGSPNVLTLGNGVQQTIGKNNRLQVRSLTVNGTLAPVSGTTFLSHTYCYSNCPTGPPADNGTIWGITDTLNAANTQGFSYDSLDRITSFSLGGALYQYITDSFGNLSAVSGGAAVAAFDPTTNRVSNLSCAGSVTPFDAAGNQLCDTDPNGGVRQYGVDAESRVTNIATLGNTASPFETYAYDANGNRVRKSNFNGTYTEYVTGGGQTLAEKNSDGTWSDYIYANGQRIARADNFDVRIHISGTNCSGCGSTNTVGGGILSLSSVPNNLNVIQYGDLLTWRQFQDGVGVGGIRLGFTNGAGSAGVLQADDGQLADGDTATGSWQMRAANLNAYQGLTLSLAILGNVEEGAPGNWDIYLGDISLVHPDGTILPIYSRTLSGFSTTFKGPAESNVSAITEDVLNSGNPADGVTSTTFYLGDHLGSTQMLTNGGGWPVSSSQFMPFGAEITTGTNPNHYKFTGKERDAESGLDYFGARYYGSSMGRFMSPDPSGAAFSDPGNPRSWNMYSYVQNNPLNSVDPDGLDCVYIDNDSGQMTGFNRGDCDNSTTASANSGYYFDGTVNTIYTTTGDTSGQVVGVQGASDATGGDLYQANPAGLSFGQPNASTSTSGMDTTINTWGNYSQTTQFNHGTHPFRDNNPGDIVSGGFVNRHGAIGADGRFGVFTSAGQGRAALDALLHSPAYSSLSVNAAVAKYAPAFENNTAGYAQFLQNAVGVSGNTPLSSLSPSQMNALENGIAHYEGAAARGNYSISVTTNF